MGDHIVNGSTMAVKCYVHKSRVGAVIMMKPVNEVDAQSNLGGHQRPCQLRTTDTRQLTDTKNIAVILMRLEFA